MDLKTPNINWKYPSGNKKGNVKKILVGLPNAACWSGSVGAGGGQRGGSFNEQKHQVGLGVAG